MAKSFRQYLFEMPGLNTITRKTSGYTDKDLDDLELPKDAKHILTTNSGHHVYQYYDGYNQHFVAHNPQTKKHDMHFAGLMRKGDKYYDERLIHGRTNSTIKADELYDEMRTKLGFTIGSDISHSQAAKSVWTKLRKRAGGKMYYQPISGGEVFAGKTGPKGELDAYYGSGKEGSLVVKPDKKKD